MSCYLNSGSLWLWPHTRLLCQTLGSGASYHRRLSSALQISLAPRLLTVAGECWNPPNTVDGKTAPVRSRTPTLWKFNMWWELKLGNVAERRERLLIRGNHRVPATRGPQSENQRRSWIMWAADETQNQNETWKQWTFQPRPRGGRGWNVLCFQVSSMLCLVTFASFLSQSSFRKWQRQATKYNSTHNSTWTWNKWQISHPQT